MNFQISKKNPATLTPLLETSVKHQLTSELKMSWRNTENRAVILLDIFARSARGIEMRRSRAKHKWKCRELSERNEEIQVHSQSLGPWICFWFNLRLSANAVN